MANEDKENNPNARSPKRGVKWSKSNESLDFSSEDSVDDLRDFASNQVDMAKAAEKNVKSPREVRKSQIKSAAKDIGLDPNAKSTSTLSKLADREMARNEQFKIADGDMGIDIKYKALGAFGKVVENKVTNPEQKNDLLAKISNQMADVDDKRDLIKASAAKQKILDNEALKENYNNSVVSKGNDSLSTSGIAARRNPNKDMMNDILYETDFKEAAKNLKQTGAKAEKSETDGQKRASSFAEKVRAEKDKGDNGMGL